jgi:hypothetical protein
MAKRMGRYRWRWGLLFAFLGFCLILPPQSQALDLADRFIQGLSFPGADAESTLGVFRPDLSVGNPSVAAAAVAPAIATAISQAVTQEFPVASVAPAFTYRFNPNLNVYERSSGVPGPLFSERALTLGKGQLNFGVGYSFIEFDELNGTDLHDINTPAYLLEVFGGGPLFPLSLTTIRTRIDLNAHVVVPALRYGITENWDISLAVPIVNTFLRIRTESVRAVDLDGFLASVDDTTFFVDRDVTTIVPIDVTTIGQIPFVKSTRPKKVLTRGAGSATGVGDISLRTKYHFWRTESGGAAVGLNLLMPSGDVEDFHGSDETHLSTFLYLSHIMAERVEPHLNVGVDFNADDVDRSSFVWSVGASFLVWRQLGLLINFLGRSEFGRFQVNVPEGQILGNLLDRSPDTCTAEQPCFLAGTRSFLAFPEPFKRNDIADFSFGLRYTLGTSGSVFFGGIIPLNDDGLRADFIPSGGIEYTF